MYCYIREKALRKNRKENKWNNKRNELGVFIDFKITIFVLSVCACLTRRKGERKKSLGNGFFETGSCIYNIHLGMRGRLVDVRGKQPCA